MVTNPQDATRTGQKIGTWQYHSMMGNGQQQEWEWEPEWETTSDRNGMELDNHWNGMKLDLGNGKRPGTGTG